MVFSWLLSLAAAQQAPKNMTKITTRLIEPEFASGSFEAQPKTLWLAGTKYARVAETVDVNNHIHGLLIISEPDAWLINLYDKSGRHVIDPDPSLTVHIPIFPTPGEAKMKLSQLELGNELEFFTANQAKQSAGEVFHGIGTTRYEATVSGRRVVLWIDTKTQKPVRISLVKGLETKTIEYVAYEELPFDSSLFQPPAGIAMQKAE